MHILFSAFYVKNDIDETLAEIFWLRHNIIKIKESKKIRALRKNCSEFKVTIKKEVITEEVEELYKLYKESINFSIAPNCNEYLHVSYLENPFDSWIIEVRENEKLIGVSFFDLGKTSMSGIFNIYHPDYKKYSLGHFLMLKRIDFCIEKNYSYLYTGYISASTTKYDYKTFPDSDACDVYLPVKNIWVPYVEFTKSQLCQFYIDNEVNKI